MTTRGESQGGVQVRLATWPDSLACPFLGDMRVCVAYLKESLGLLEATLARRGLHSGSPLVSQARLRVPRAPSVGTARPEYRCDWGVIER
jgi:hypothetical protein